MSEVKEDAIEENKRKTAYDIWDESTKILTDEEIQEIIDCTNTFCGVFCGVGPLDEWEEEHLRLIDKHELTWKEYRPMHAKYIVRKHNMDVSDELIDQAFGCKKKQVDDR